MINYIDKKLSLTLLMMVFTQLISNAQIVSGEKLLDLDSTERDNTKIQKNINKEVLVDTILPKNKSQEQSDNNKSIYLISDIIGKKQKVKNKYH